MIQRTPNRDIVLVSGPDVGVDKSWMPIGMFQLDTETGALLQKTPQGIVYRSERSETVELGGDFTAGEEVKCTRIGSSVTITTVGIIAHSSAAQPVSNSGVIPEIYRPPTNAGNAYYQNASALFFVGVTSAGLFFTSYRNYSGTGTAMTGTAIIASVTYNV